MLKSLFISAGCSQRPKTSLILNDYLIYSSNCNIVYYNLNTKEITLNSVESPIRILYSYMNSIVCITDSGKVLYDYKLYCQDIFIHSTDIKIYNNTVYISTLDDVIILRDGNIIDRLLHLKYITSIEIHNGFIYCGSIVGDIYIFNITNRSTCKISAHSNRISDIKYMDNLLYSVSHDSTTKIWNIKEGKLTLFKTFSDHTSLIHSLTVINPNIFLTTGDDNSILLYKDSTVERFGSIIGRKRAFYNSLYYKGSIIGQGHTGGFYFFTGEGLKYLIGGHTKSVSSLDWSSGLLLSTSLDMSGRIFNKDMEILRPVQHGFPLNSGKMYKGLVYICSEETVIRIYEPTQLTQSILNPSITNRLDMLDIDTSINIKWATNSELSLSNQVFEEGCIEDKIKEGISEKTLSDQLLYGERDKILSNYFEICDIAVSDKYIFSINKSSCMKYGGIFMFSRQTYKKLSYTVCHKLNINKLVLSDDERFLLAVSRDKTASHYKIEEGKLYLLKHLKDHKREIYSGAYGENLIATVGRDNIINIYSLPKYTMVGTVEINGSVAEFINTECILIGTLTGEIIVYNFIDSNILYRSTIHSGRVNCIKVDGNTVATGGEDGMIRLFTINF